jgi:hypothetical protein
MALFRRCMSVGELGSGRTLEEDLLARAAEDWVHPAELLEVVRRRGIEDPELQRHLAVGLVAKLVAQGLIVVGDVGDGHVPWACSPGDAVLRLARDWAERQDPSVMPGELFWLDTTPAGQAVGEAVWSRES